MTNALESQWAVFEWLLCYRWVGYVLSAVVFGGALVPFRLRLVITIPLAVSLGSSDPIRRSVEQAISRPPEGTFAIHSAVELVIGLALGWSLLVVVGSIRAASRFVSEEIGWSSEATIGRSTSSASLAQFHSLLALVVFFGADLHHRAIETFTVSVTRLSPGSLDWETAPRLLLHVVSTTGPDLVTAMATLVLPVALALLAVSGCVGFGGRVLPRSWLLFLGAPLRCGVGLVVLGATVPWSAKAIEALLGASLRHGLERLLSVG